MIDFDMQFSESVMSFDPKFEKTGPAGPAGADGKTPVYGVDYGTPEQICEIAQSAAKILQPDVNQIKGDLAQYTNYPFTNDSRLYRSAYGTGQVIKKNSILQLRIYAETDDDWYIHDFYSTEKERRISIRNENEVIRYNATSDGRYDGVELCELRLMVRGVETDEIRGYALIDWTNVSIGGTGYVKGDANILYSCITMVDELVKKIDEKLPYSSEIASKVSKNGTNEVDHNNIDGTFEEYRAIEISGESVGGYYITGSGTVGNAGSGQAPTTSRNVIDLDEISGNIEIGFSTTESMYGNNIIFLGENTTSGTVCVGYFSKSNISSNLKNLFDLSKTSENRLIVDIEKLKEEYPTAHGMFICQPTSIWYLAELHKNTKKKLEWLNVTGFIPAIIVAKDGSGDYESIQDAIDNATNNTTIYIKDGEYKETVIVDKYVHLVGQSKHNTVLYQDIGDYNNAPLLITQGSVCNLTIKSFAPSDTSDLSDYAYAIHLDKNFAGDSKYRKCEIYNCCIISEVNDAVGAGTNYDEVFDLHDNYIYVVANPVKTGACGFKCHIGASQTGGKITLKNNTIIAENSNGTSFYDVFLHDGGLTASIKIPVELIGNVCKTFRNVSTVYELNQYCYGNSVPEMNTLN